MLTIIVNGFKIRGIYGYASDLKFIEFIEWSLGPLLRTNYKIRRYKLFLFLFLIIS